jgi:hypothetical protein
MAVHPSRPLQRTLEGAALACLLVGLAACKPTGTGTGTEPPDLRLGINIEGLAYWGTEIPVVNLMKMSSPWLTQCEPRQDAYCADGLFGMPEPAPG